MKKIFALIIVMCFTLFTATAQQICSNQTGSSGGYWYTFWTDGGGSVCMTLGSGGQFSVQWSNCGNFVCGKGWSTGSDRTITWSGSTSGAQYYGVYGWLTNPLVEYYIPRSGGTNRGTYSADGRTYTLYTNTRVNQPSIVGTTTFEQYFCGGGSGSPVNFGQHLAGWRSLGMGVGSQNYQVVAVEGWGGSSGSANVTVGSGSSTTTSTASSTTTTTSTSGSTTTSSTGTGNITVRARGVTGNERVEVRVNGSAVASFTVSTSYSNYSANGSGTIQVAFTNDNGSDYDVQVDYITVNGTTYQAENQSTNTGVYQNSSCGGSNSEWLHCNGYIEFNTGSTTPVPGTTTTTSTSGSTTTSSTSGTTTSTSSGSTCSPATSKSVPFTQDGAGEYCFSTSSNISYINSWNMATLTVNGVNFTNKWASGSSLPAKINGNYYIVYKGNYAWSHFEAR